MAQPRTFGSCLAEHLLRGGWSQRRFAAAIGESQPFVARIIGGTRRPPLERVGRWIAVLALDPADAHECALLALAAHDALALADYLLPSAKPARAAEPPVSYQR